MRLIKVFTVSSPYKGEDLIQHNKQKHYKTGERELKPTSDEKGLLSTVCGQTNLKSHACHRGIFHISAMKN